MINPSSVSLPLIGFNPGSLHVTTASPSHLSSIYATRGSLSSSPGTPSYLGGGAYNDGSFSPVSPISTAPISSSSMSIFLGMSSPKSVPTHAQDFTQKLDLGLHTSYDLASRVTTNSLPNSASLNPTPLSQALLNVMTNKSAANQSFTDLASPTKVQVSSLLPSKANSVISGGFSEPSTPLHYDHSPLSSSSSTFHSNPSSPTIKVSASTNFSSLLNLQTVPTSTTMLKSDKPSFSVVSTASENLTKNFVNQNFVLPSHPLTDLTTQVLQGGGDQKLPVSSSLLADNLMNIMALKDLKDQSFTEIESPVRKRPTKLETGGENLLSLHQQPMQEDIQSIVREFTPKNNNFVTTKELTSKKQDILQNIVKEFTSPKHSRQGSSASTHYSSKQGERKTSLNEDEIAISKNPSNFSNSQQVQMILKEFGTKESSLAEIVQVPLSAGLKKESDKSSGPNSIQDLGYKPFELPKSGISTPTHNHHASSLAFGRLLSLNSPMHHHHTYPQSEGSSPFHAAFSGKIVVKSIPNGFKEQLKKKGMEAQVQESEFNNVSKQYLSKSFKKPSKIDSLSNVYQRVLMKKNMRKKSSLAY